MKPPVIGWVEVTIEYEVLVPSLDETSAAEKVPIKVPAWKDSETQEVYLDHRAEAMIENVKARRMGLLSTKEIKEVRLRMGLNQAEISDLLQIGKRSWTRWESGRERPSRVINVLLRALADEKIDKNYLLGIRMNKHQMGRVWPVNGLALDSFGRQAPRYNTSNAHKTQALAA